MADKPIDDFGAMNSDVMSEFDLDVQEPQYCQHSALILFLLLIFYPNFLNAICKTF